MNPEAPNNENPNEEAFAGTPEEQMRFEIEMLKLKISAELGGEVGRMSPENNLPPEIEKQFLEQILSFHSSRGEATTLGAHLGNPTFPPAESLSEEALEQEWEKVEELYASKAVAVGFIANYPLALRYTFMTSELLEADFESYGEGFTTNFIYEEFHPNLPHDQRELTNRFMYEIFEGAFSSITLSQTLVSKSGATKTAAEVQLLLDRFHSLFPTLGEPEFFIEDVEHQEQDDEDEEKPLLGFTRGKVKYSAVTAEGEAQEIEGPFQLFMQYRWGMWEILNFYLHGFSWK